MDHFANWIIIRFVNGNFCWDLNAAILTSIFL